MHGLRCSGLQPGRYRDHGAGNNSAAGYYGASRDRRRHRGCDRGPPYHT